MITCKICHRFVKDIETTYNPFESRIIKVEGFCSMHGRVECDYEYSEELNLQEADEIPRIH